MISIFYFFCIKFLQFFVNSRYYLLIWSIAIVKVKLPVCRLSAISFLHRNILISSSPMCLFLGLVPALLRLYSKSSCRLKYCEGYPLHFCSEGSELRVYIKVFDLLCMWIFWSWVSSFGSAPPFFLLVSLSLVEKNLVPLSKITGAYYCWLICRLLVYLTVLCQYQLSLLL